MDNDFRRFNVKVYLNNGEGSSYVYDAKIEFSCNPNDYGNGYHMGIKATEEAFGYDAYDIRYDTEFNVDDPISYIVQFYSHRYDGKRNKYKLVGIRIHVAEFEELEEK